MIQSLTTRRRAHRPLGAILLTLLLSLAACTSSDDTSAATAEPSTTSSEPPATSAPSPTTDQPSPTTTPSSTTEPSTTTISTTVSTTDPPTTPCPPQLTLPDGARDVSFHTGDPDGDGSMDELVTYRGVDDRWYLRADLASGATVETAITASGLSIGGRPFVGAHDLDRNGDDELFTRAGTGAAADLVALWDLESCQLAAVTLDGVPAVFPVGASAGAATGLSCSNRYVDDLYFADLSSRDGQLYEGVIAAYDLDDGRLLNTGVEGAGYNGDDLGTIAGLHCGPLVLA